LKRGLHKAKNQKERIKEEQNLKSNHKNKPVL